MVRKSRASPAEFPTGVNAQFVVKISIRCSKSPSAKYTEISNLQIIDIKENTENKQNMMQVRFSESPFSYHEDQRD